MVTLVDGKKLAESLKNDMQSFITEQSSTPSLHIIYVGSDPVIDNFVRYKKRFGSDIGAEVVVHNLNADISQDDLITYIADNQSAADGVIVQLPLPEHLDVDVILNSVPADKDIDVLGQEARDLFIENKTKFFPPVTGAIAFIAQEHSVDFATANTLIVGSGRLVGYPTMLWMDRESYQYTLIDKHTDVYVVHQLMNESDIIISGAGQPHMIKDFFVKEGVVLFDAGTSESGKKIVGDVDPDAYKKAILATPVPGGIGPLTIALLYYNLLHATYSYYDRNISTTS